MDFQAAVIIPTHNRPQLLQQVLDSVLAQSVPTEIFVMDDASSSETVSLVRQKYPQVSYHREALAKGPTFQRNKAAALTKAPILFTIDDDCILPSARTIEQTLASFDHPRIGAVTIPFINILQSPNVITGDPDPVPQVTFDYYGGMVALRRQVYLGVGGYRPYFFIQVEESDMAIRFYDAGYVVRLGSADPIHHMESPVRDSPGRDARGPRNQMLFTYYNVPWPIFPVHLAQSTLLCLLHGLHTHHPLRVIRGLSQGYAGMWIDRRSRKPVSNHAYRLTRRLRRIHKLPLDEIEPELPPRRDFSAI